MGGRRAVLAGVALAADDSRLFAASAAPCGFVGFELAHGVALLPDGALLTVLPGLALLFALEDVKEVVTDLP